MSYIEVIVNNCIYLLCPLALYFIYTTYQKNVDQEKDYLTFEIAVISSVYFVLRYGLSLHGKYPTMLFDIPLLLCFYKKRTNLSIVISILLIFYQVLVLHIHPLLVGMEYLTYFIFYKKKKEFTIQSLVQGFIIINSFFLSLKIFLFINPRGIYQENFIYLISLLAIIYLISTLILSFFDKSEKIVDFNTTLYNIEKEKELRSSLFKVTHEIKNPIAVCKGYLDMLDLNNQKKVHQYIPIVKEEINRTLTLMDDFLDYTKIKIIKEEIDLVMLLEEIGNSLRSLLKEKGISYRLEVEKEEIYMEADYNRLKQVFINLIKNSIEAKDVEKSENYVYIKVKEDNNKIKVSIEDNGIGMEEEDCQKVCEMFYTTKEKGSGLGTSLSKEIIELHNGKMIYDSKKKKGTTVKITLPK